MAAVPLAEVERGGRLESLHLGHAVICGPDGGILEAWGDPDAVIFPRSSCKMIQALPLVESGAADAAGLGSEQLALACASHQGAAIHTARVAAWLEGLGLGDDDFRCGPELPREEAARLACLCGGDPVRQIHNNCSGKHAGFLTLTRHLGAGPDYVDPAHPVQQAVRAAFEEVTGELSPGFGIDGCSAPNFATSVAGLARAMAAFAAARSDSTRGEAMVRLREAMVRHPDLVAGEGRACTALMRAMSGVAVKTGAEGVFVAILPAQGLGIALKVQDGATRAAEAAIAALLVRSGALDAAVAESWTAAPIVNRRGLVTGQRPRRLRPGPLVRPRRGRRAHAHLGRAATAGRAA